MSTDAGFNNPSARRWATAAKVATALAAALVTIATSRLLSTDARGELAAGMAGAVLGGSILSWSLWLGTSIELRRHPELAHPTRVLAFAYPMLLAVVLVPATALIAGGWDVVWPWAALSALVFASYSILQGLPVGAGDLRAYAVGELIRGWPGGAACILVAATTGNAGAAVAAWGCGALAGAVYLAHRSGPGDGAPRISAYLQAVGPASVRAHGGNILGLLSIRLDLVLLASVSSAAEVAYYSLAIAFAEVLWIFSAAQGVAHLSDLVRADLSEARAMTRRALTRVVAIVTPMALVLGASAEWLLPLVAGGPYQAAAGPLRISLIAAGLYGLIHVLGPFVAAGLRRPGLVTINGMLMLAVNIPILLWLGPDEGAMGAAVASAAAYGVGAAMYLYLLWRPPSQRRDVEVLNAPAETAGLTAG